jgi:hypothetical protein
MDYRPFARRRQQAPWMRMPGLPAYPGRWQRSEPPQWVQQRRLQQLRRYEQLLELQLERLQGRIRRFEEALDDSEPRRGRREYRD